jgi:hypothetical protein
MKVYIGPYKNWIGPTQIAEKILFWKNNRDDKSVEYLGDKLASIDMLVKLCNWVHSKRKRKIKIRIDEQDVWNLDGTLAYIIHPALQKLRDNPHGAPFVDDEDVPDYLKKSAAPPTKNEWDADDNHFKRWEYVLDEMIFAFETKNSDWKDDCTDNWDSRKEVEKRIQNGFVLFGKYYQALWT